MFPILLNLILIIESLSFKLWTEKTVRDGLPKLYPIISTSSPFVPTEQAHAKCSRTECNFPRIFEVRENVWNQSNACWRSVDEGKLSYSSERDIVFIVMSLFRDIMAPLGLKLKFCSELTIKSIRPDICVILDKWYLVGVVEVKKPGKNVLSQPTVLGELFDQMLLVEGYYGMGPVIGILTTAEEWVFSWFPSDSQALRDIQVLLEDLSISLKRKATSATELEEEYKQSPFCATPSQKSSEAHQILIADIDENIDMFDSQESSQQVDRHLCTTRVLNIYEEAELVIQHLCSAFLLMSASRKHNLNVSRCMFKFYLDTSTVTYHPMSYETVFQTVDFNLFPLDSTKTLIAMEDLGRGATGKAWLCVTVTKTNAAVCVLKFSNKDDNDRHTAELGMWHILYPEFNEMVKVQHWSGANALVMPHFSTVIKQDRQQQIEKVREVLKTKFMTKNKVHTDVCWRNIGRYKNDVIDVIVVFDLHDVVEYDVSIHKDWINTAILRLEQDLD